MAARKNQMKNISQHAYDLMAQIERDKRGNPLTLDGAIRSVMLKSPDTFRYRDDALGVLYCVLGAGIDWQDGRLVDVHPNNYMNMPPGPGEHGVWSRDFGLDESLRKMGKDVYEHFRDSFLEEHKKELQRAIDTVHNIDERCQQYRSEMEGKPSWYPMSWYASRLCVPEDVQPDYLDGAIETATLILRHEPRAGTKQWIEHQRTKKHSEDVLRILLERKK